MPRVYAKGGLKTLYLDSTGWVVMLELISGFALIMPEINFEPTEVPKEFPLFRLLPSPKKISINLKPFEKKKKKKKAKIKMNII